jgi:hypothetical protein
LHTATRVGPIPSDFAEGRSSSERGKSAGSNAALISVAEDRTGKQLLATGICACGCGCGVECRFRNGRDGDRLHAAHGVCICTQQHHLPKTGLLLTNLELWTAQSCSVHSDIETALACHHGLTRMYLWYKVRRCATIHACQGPRGGSRISNLESRMYSRYRGAACLIAAHRWRARFPTKFFVVRVSRTASTPTHRLDRERLLSETEREKETERERGDWRFYTSTILLPLTSTSTSATAATTFP